MCAVDIQILTDVCVPPVDKVHSRKFLNIIIRGVVVAAVVLADVQRAKSKVNTVTIGVNTPNFTELLPRVT